jgi:hypothetical protein
MSHWLVSNIKATNNLPFAFFSRLGFQVPLLIISAIKKVSVNAFNIQRYSVPTSLSPLPNQPITRSQKLTERGPASSIY